MKTEDLTFLGCLGLIIIAIIAVIFWGLFWSLPVMWLWNWIIPSLIPGVGALTWLKAWGLSILSGILVGGVNFKGLDSK